MIKSQVLERAEAAVSTLDGLLTHLDKLTNDAQTLSSAIEALKVDENNALQSEAAEEQKIKSILRTRAAIDVKSASLKKLQNEIGAIQEDIRPVGDKANLFIGAIFDALVVSRRARVSLQLEAIFIHQAQLELQRFLPYSVAVHEIETGIGRLQGYIAAQVERNVDTARKVRPVFDQLAALAEAEEHLEVVTGADW
jgi:chromosome segregation ATPase